MSETPTFGPVQPPAFLYGTAWKEQATSQLTLQALETGFRGIDTANQPRHYQESGVGEALRRAFDAGLVTREQVFVQTKFTPPGGQDARIPYDPDAPAAEQVRESFARSLEHLGVTGVDSYVLHGPSHRLGLTDTDVAIWRAMEDLHDAGRTRHLGISNVTADQVEELCRAARVKPAFVQNRCFAATGWDRDVRDACRRHGIRHQAFSLLTANREILGHPRVTALASEHGRTPAQVIFRLALELDMLPLTGTSDAEHARQDLAVTQFRLDEASVRELEALAG